MRNVNSSCKNKKTSRKERQLLIRQLMPLLLSKKKRPAIKLVQPTKLVSKSSHWSLPAQNCSLTWWLIRLLISILKLQTEMKAKPLSKRCTSFVTRKLRTLPLLCLKLPKCASMLLLAKLFSLSSSMTRLNKLETSRPSSPMSTAVRTWIRLWRWRMVFIRFIPVVLTPMLKQNSSALSDPSLTMNSTRSKQPLLQPTRMQLIKALSSLITPSWSTTLRRSKTPLSFATKSSLMRLPRLE